MQHVYLIYVMLVKQKEATPSFTINGLYNPSKYTKDGRFVIVLSTLYSHSTAAVFPLYYGNAEPWTTKRRQSDAAAANVLVQCLLGQGSLQLEGPAWFFCFLKP